MQGPGTLLFVRGVEDIPSAVRAVNELLSRRRSRGSIDHPLLGILVGVDLDSALHEQGCEKDEMDVTVVESVGLSGIWSLCWFGQPDVRVRC